MGEMSLSDVLPGMQAPPPPQRRRSSARARERRRRRRQRRTALLVLVGLVVVGGGMAGAWAGLSPIIHKLTAPKDYAGPGTGRAVVRIVSGASGRDIGNVLVEAGVVKTQQAFVDAYSSDPRGKSLQPGTYQLKQQMTGAGALALLLAPSSRLTLTVTVPEGKRVPETLALLARDLHLSRGALDAAVNDPIAIGLPASADGNAEGFLFPARYDFEPGVTAVEAVRAMVTRQRTAMAQLGVPAGREREVVVEASIVQAEARNRTYMGMVATVLNNRLAHGIKLQLDSTVSYATQRFGVTTTPADRASRSRYNTYMYPGLPAGPIDSPGDDAINAVLHPTPGPWLYFVTVNPLTGETKFAATAAQHAVNVRQFQAWLRAHPGS